MMADSSNTSWSGVAGEAHRTDLIARSRGHRFTLTAILCVAVAVRLGYCLLVLPGDKGLLSPGNDDWQYDRCAVNLLDGHGMAMNPGQPTAQRTPGYPIFLAAVYGVAGHSYVAVRIAQALVGGLACLLVFLLARRWTSETVGLLASGILAVYPMHVWLTGELLSENLTVPGLLLMLLVLDDAGHTPLLSRWVLAGLTLTLVGSVHPILTVLGCVLAGVLVLHRVYRGRPVLRCGTAMLILCLAFPLGWSARNHVVMGRWMISSLGGATLLGANNILTVTDPRYRGYWVGEWEIPGVRKRLGYPQDEVARSDGFRRFAVEWLRDHPHYWPRLAAYKLFRFYAPLLGEWSSPEGLVYLGTYGLLLPMTVIGFWRALRRPEEIDRFGVLLIATVVAYYTAIVVVYWGAPRFRQTIEPLFILLAAHTIRTAHAWVRARRWVDRRPLAWQVRTDAV